MLLRATLNLILPLVFSSALWADTLQIKPNHPERYTVVRGDTLWDISGKFLQHPWQWPHLWRHNPHIQDPHWIYPGDTLYFSYVNGEPSLSLTPPGSSTEPDISPRTRESAIEKAIPVIPIDAIAQFLTSPKVVSADDLENAPYIVAMAGEHLVAGAGDRIYVRTIEDPEALAYTVYRAGKPYVDPETHEILGYEAQYIAETTIERPGDPATLHITKSDQEVQRGDRLMPSSQGEMPLNYFPRPSSQPITGNIIRVMGGVSQIGQHDVVVIDRGTADGIETGHIFDIYQKGRVINDTVQGNRPIPVKLPDEIAGLLMVFRTFEHVSYALVMEATAAIHTLDRIQTP